MVSEVYFTKTLFLGLKREFSNDVFSSIETECKRMWNNGENPFDIYNFEHLLTFNNLTNKSFHKFITFTTLELIPIEPVGIDSKFIKVLNNISFNFKITSEKFTFLLSNESNLKLVNSKGDIYILTKDEMSNFGLMAHS